MNGRDGTIDELRALVAKQAAQIEQLTARIAELELELAKARKDSSTSSKPPSSDITKPKPKKKPGRRKKPRRGGQPGHKQQLRKPLPPERVDETIDYEIDDEEVRRLGLTPTGDFECIQHIELPDTPVHVTEYRLAVYQDADGQLYIPDCPEVKGPIFGPRLLATIGWLKSVGHCSYSTIEAWMEDVLQVPVSRGYLAKLCTGTISASLADAYDEVAEAIPRQEQLGSDETSIKDNGKKHWIWCITAATFSLFHIAATRSREVLEKLVGRRIRRLPELRLLLGQLLAAHDRRSRDGRVGLQRHGSTRDARHLGSPGCAGRHSCPLFRCIEAAVSGPEISNKLRSSGIHPVAMAPSESLRLLRDVAASYKVAVATLGWDKDK